MYLFFNLRKMKLSLSCLFSLICRYKIHIHNNISYNFAKCTSDITQLIHCSQTMQLWTRIW